VLGTDTGYGYKLGATNTAESDNQGFGHGTPGDMRNTSKFASLSI
jgi:hypothetical protein